MNGFDAISKCPRPHCQGTLVPFTGQVETDNQNLWKCLLCTRTIGEVPPVQVTEKERMRDQSNSTRMANYVTNRSRTRPRDFYSS